MQIVLGHNRRTFAFMSQIIKCCGEINRLYKELFIDKYETYLARISPDIRESRIVLVGIVIAFRLGGVNQAAVDVRAWEKQPYRIILDEGRILIYYYFQNLEPTVLDLTPRRRPLK